MRSEDINTRRQRSANGHQMLTDRDVPRRVNGQKLGLRKRMQLWLEQGVKL